MASNREERLQMRQRGAGTRQIKAVDFGFSFGLPAPAPQEPSRHSPQRSTNPPETRVSSRRSATPNKKPTPPSQPQRATPSSGSHSSQRERPSSSRSRNHLPERPSTFDIPSDDVPEQGRSAKRRRISPLLGNAKQALSSTRKDPVDEQPTPGAVTSNDAAQPDDGVDDTLFAERNRGQQVEPESHVVNGTNGINTGHTEEVQSENVRDPSPQSSKRQRKKRKSSIKEPPEKGSTAESATAANNTEAETQEPVETTEVPRTSPRLSKKAIESQESLGQQETRKRGRAAAAKAASNAGKNTEKETSPAEGSSRPPKRSRKSLGKQRELPTDVQEVDNQPQEEPEEAGETLEEYAEQQEENQKSRQKSSKKKGKQRKPPGRPPVRDRRSIANVPEEPEASSSRQRRDSDEEQEVEQAPVAESSRRKSSATKKAPKKAKTRKENTTRADENEEAEEAEEAEEEEEEDSTAKEKKARGKTVPITVHRLANVEALAVIPDSEESASDAESTVKQLSGRSGVNPADILGQICRETLEKTLTTLKDAIGNESNQARRAEWTRKRKAVEAFGTELEGRLFEISEMLDSNFSLNTQLKKAKRKMVDMRSRLLQVRRQREEIALRMDEVRRKHTEDENTKMARNAINNSLHSLELAIDRNKARTDRSSDDEHPPTTAGLEFMLRTIAENVSSAAPGSQGGLLNQIKSFNAQLERTAKKLERMG